MDKDKVHEMVREGYGAIALAGSSCCGSSSCCGGSSKTETQVRAKSASGKIGYSEEEMDSVPDGANLGLGCGNPTALAGIVEGETIIDLGSGAGFDCFLAARKTGPTGRVIGIDMTPAMLDRARKNAAEGGYDKVEFRLGEIENIPAANETADLLISNCVINLSPDKPKVFKEAFRVLKKGGRMMISDIVLLKELPKVIMESAAAYIGCLSGAEHLEDYLEMIRAAGFKEVKIEGKSTFNIDYLKDDPEAAKIMKESGLEWDDVKDAGDAFASLKVSAKKPV